MTRINLDQIGETSGGVRGARRAAPEAAQDAKAATGVKVPTSVADPDTLGLSARASEVGRYVETARSLPEVRADRVEVLRTAIAKRSYQPSASVIADAILTSRD